MADNKRREPSAPKGISMLGMLQESQQASKPTVAMPEQEQTSPVQEPAVSDGELWNKFLENMIKYTGVKEQGSAVWLPSDVKKRLDDFRATAFELWPTSYAYVRTISTITSLQLTWK